MPAGLLTASIAIISTRNALETLLARRVPPAKSELNHNPVYASPTLHSTTYISRLKL